MNKKIRFPLLNLHECGQEIHGTDLIITFTWDLLPNGKADPSSSSKRPQEDITSSFN
jgi:hypothetical protein